MCTCCLQSVVFICANLYNAWLVTPMINWFGFADNSCSTPELIFPEVTKHIWIRSEGGENGIVTSATQTKFTKSNCTPESTTQHRWKKKSSSNVPAYQLREVTPGERKSWVAFQDERKPRILTATGAPEYGGEGSGKSDKKSFPAFWLTGYHGSLYKSG